MFLPALQVFRMWPLFHGDHFPEMIKLGQLYFTLPVHTAGCERVFSVQNSTLTPSRNRLQDSTQDTLMRVRLGPDRDHFNFASALSKWQDKKDRRIYELNNILLPVAVAHKFF